MNIVWFTWKDLANPLAGGAEVVAHELAKHLVADGHSVTFITAGFPGAAPTARRDGYHIVRVGSRHTVYVAAWRYYRAHRDSLAPDLVIDECNTIPFFTGWYAGAPTISLFHMLCRSIWFHQLPQPFSTIGYLAEPVYLRLLKRAPVITVSESSKRDLIRHGFRAADIHLISEGIEIEPLDSLDTATKLPETTLLSFGAIRPMKRTLHQIQAFEMARDHHPDIKLIVAGDASSAYGRKVLKYIKSSRHAGSIDYRGRVSTAEKTALMQQCHALLFSSVKEGWGLVVTEANSQGTPAIVYNVDGLRDSVRNNETGLITVANTPTAMATAICTMLQNPDDYDRLRTAAWLWSREITFDQSYQDFQAVLNTALPRAAVAPAD